MRTNGKNLTFSEKSSPQIGPEKAALRRRHRPLTLPEHTLLALVCQSSTHKSLLLQANPLPQHTSPNFFPRLSNTYTKPEYNSPFKPQMASYSDLAKGRKLFNTLFGEAAECRGRRSGKPKLPKGLWKSADLSEAVGEPGLVRGEKMRVNSFGSAADELRMGTFITF